MSNSNDPSNEKKSNDLLTTQDLSQINEILDAEFADDKSQSNDPAEKTNPKTETPETVGSPVRTRNASQPEKIGYAGANKNMPNKGLPRKKKPKKNYQNILKYVLITLGVCAAAGLIGIFVLYQANFRDISAEEYMPKEKTRIYSADNVLIAELFSENRDYITIDQVPQSLKDALISTEDSRFYSHNGVDYLGVIRALISNILSGSSTGQGASTLTQQLARLLYLPDISTENSFLDSLNRKFREISIAYQLEDKYDKDQILEMYLNEYYFGSGAYGVEAASQTYFGKHVKELNLAESAILAGLPQAPSSYEPNSNFEAAKKRQKEVLQRMVSMGKITQEEADQAYNQELHILPWSPAQLDNQIKNGYARFVSAALQEIAEYSAPNLMKQNGMTQEEAIYSVRSDIASGGYVIYTTILSSYQSDAMETADARLASYGYDQADGETCAIVTVDLDGAVRCYYGGNETYSDIDMASSARQPGSNIKPLYYSYALESGKYTTSSILVDRPKDFYGYRPQNYGNSYSGNITFAQSLIQSKNVTSTEIFDNVGVDNAINWMKSMGISTFTEDDQNLAIATGGLTYGIEPIEMAAAFNIFNNSGIYNEPYKIIKVTNSKGDTLISKDQLGLKSKRIMSENTAQTMWGLLRQIVTSSTGYNASTSEPTAGKTGTTDNEEDLWFTGMTGNLTTSVWLGQLDHRVMGGSSALPAGIYGSYMQTLLNNDMVSQYNPDYPPKLINQTEHSYQGPGENE